MQITEEVQAEIMEILLDDQMKHAEFPTDEEMQAMFEAAEPEDWAKARQVEEMNVEQMLCPVPHRIRYEHEPTPAENTAEQLADIERGNVEASRNTYRSHD